MNHCLILHEFLNAGHTISHCTSELQTNRLPQVLCSSQQLQKAKAEFHFCFHLLAAFSSFYTLLCIHFFLLDITSQTNLIINNYLQKVI